MMQQQGWHNGNWNWLANMSSNEISLPQGQGSAKRKYFYGS